MSWNFMEPAGRKNLDEIWRREAEGMFELASDPAVWQAPTAAGHWQVRDVIAHMVDTTEVYLHSFAAARGEAESREPLGVRDMSTLMDKDALAMRDVSQDELLTRLRRDLDRILDVVNGLGDDEWTQLLVPHKYMGPVPACFLPVCQMLDYIVHTWDIRQGLGRSHVLQADAADMLVPVCFLMWQNTNDPVGVEPFTIGIRVTSGPNAGETRAAVSESGVEFTPGSVDDLATVLEFDPASLVLAAFGRANTGTCRGDRDIADRYLNLFYRI
ncbi:maleylpyruvate isomerase family mycothiol-dependent enzyme [Streptomyces sp. WMMC1477]|uniref:maleylpyruvate isomerase family mycothiol-dependent enzyme n=1 Tax=Streptomyces sp. WMMC1477 TaxID=3015155 RepID=UPI0022B70ED9|nr:maleylpyruvate isomerase family mycothiol-dependent enzyme [Streptomyces sp. WMMC1477]MCZ7431114.1 maleylpyruvate isomerase family mycothiol-dependent enzyme [Streptomyces sp. WMMC1477]